MIEDLITKAAWERWVGYFKHYGLGMGHECLTWSEWKALYQAGIIL